MAITKMNRFSLVCLKKDIKPILKELQHLGCLELICLDEQDDISNFKKVDMDNDIVEVDVALGNLRRAINVLEKYELKISMIDSLKKGKEAVLSKDIDVLMEHYNWDEIAKEIVKKSERTLEIYQQKELLKEEIVSLIPWKAIDVPIEDIVDTINVRRGMGCISRKYKEKIVETFDGIPLAEIKIVSETEKFIYFVWDAHNSVIGAVSDTLKTTDYAEYKIKRKGVIEDIKLVISQEIKALDEEKACLIEALAKNEELMHLRMCEEHFLNKKERLLAEINFIESSNTIAISGWVPIESNGEVVSRIEYLTEKVSTINFEEVREEEDLCVPVKLKNNKFFSAFETITEMYSLPNYKGIDPTPMLAPFYMLFFGMMMGDFGYGAIILIASIFALKKFNMDEGMRKFAQFFKWLGISTIGWGLVYGAGFGDKIKFESLLDMNADIMTIMALSIGFGVIQILVALGIKAYMLVRARQYFAVFADVVLWLISFVGIAMFAMGIPGGKWIMIFGMVGIVLTNGRESENVTGKLATGAYALYGITNYVGDLVSYTRLMALGVAGGSIASAMNLIIGYLPQNLIVMLILTPLLFIACHVFNLLLGALGAYVHSCRLQYVEYFGKFYDGGGRAFKPLKNIDKNINIK